jgi:hypothetical protein
MVEVGIAEYFGIGEALGIIGTMFIVLYFSRKQMQRLTVDIETKVLNDLDEKMQTLTQMTVDRPELVKILNKDESDWTPRDRICLSYFVYLCTCVSYVAKKGIN